MSNVEFRRIPTADLTLQSQKDFVDTGILKTLHDLMFGPNLILKGPKGAGKTISFEQLAAQNAIPLLRQECCEETSVRDLLGTYSAQGGDVFFQMGSVTAAIDVANEVGCCILVLEEINTLPPMTQKILNPLCDYRKAVSLPKAGKVFRVEEGKLLWVVGTMNPNYAGTYSLNEDFRSRFEFIEVNYMDMDKERALLLSQFPTPPSAKEKQDVDKLMNIAKETRSERMGYALSTRDLVQFIRNMLSLDRDRALKLLEGKYEGEHISSFRARIQSGFGVNLNTVKLYG